MIWDHDGFWQKANQYIERAFECEREGGLFAFWASLSLEFLARAALAKVHPALLADPTDGGKSLLFAFGYDTTDKPKSVSISTVYIRCTTIEPDFTKEIADSCQTISERRNSELHSGHLAFEGVGTGVWLPHFYRGASILLRMQGKTLDDYLPADEAAVAQLMIDGLEKKYRDQAAKAIGLARSRFEALTAGEQAARRAHADAEMSL